MCLEDQPLRPVEARAGLGYPHVAHARAHAVSPAKVAATSSSPQLSSDQSTDGVTKRQAVTPCTMAMTEHVSSLDAVPPAKTVAPLFNSIKSRAGFFIAWLNDCADYHARRLRRIQFRAARCGRRPVSGRSAPKPPGRPPPYHPTGDDVAPFLASALNDKFAAACGFSDSCYLSTYKDGSGANVIPLCQSEVALDSRLSLPIDTVLDGGYRIDTCGRLRRFRYHLRGRGHQSRHDGRSEGILSLRLRRPRHDHECAAEVRAPQENLRLGPLQLSAGSTHARPLRAPKHRARHARVRDQLHRLHGDALRGGAELRGSGSAISAALPPRTSSTVSPPLYSTRFR